MTWARYLGGIGCYCAAVAMGTSSVTAFVVGTIALVAGLQLHGVRPPGAEDPRRPPEAYL